MVPTAGATCRVDSADGLTSAYPAAPAGGGSRSSTCSHQAPTVPYQQHVTCCTCCRLTMTWTLQRPRRYLPKAYNKTCGCSTLTATHKEQQQRPRDFHGSWVDAADSDQQHPALHLTWLSPSSPSAWPAAAAPAGAAGSILGSSSCVSLRCSFTCQRQCRRRPHLAAVMAVLLRASAVLWQYTDWHCNCGRVRPMTVCEAYLLLQGALTMLGKAVLHCHKEQASHSCCACSTHHLPLCVAEVAVGAHPYIMGTCRHCLVSAGREAEVPLTLALHAGFVVEGATITCCGCCCCCYCLCCPGYLV